MDYIVTISKDVNFELLIEQVKALSLPESGVSILTRPNGDRVVTVHFTTEPTNAQKAAIDALLTAHNAAELTTLQTAELAAKAEVITLALKDKNPQQLITWLRNQIDGWATLADAKSTLSLALPVMLALILRPDLLND